MKPIHLVLLVGAYGCLLPFNAAWIVVSSNSYVSPFGVEGLILIWVQSIVVRGYSQAVAGWRPSDKPRLFWAFSAVINLLIFIGALRVAGSGPLLGEVRSHLIHFRDAFYPDLRKYETLPAVAGLAWVLAVCWMPVAVLLSLVAGAAAWRKPAKMPEDPG